MARFAVAGAAAAAFAIACATAPPPASYADRWIGVRLQDFIVRHGIPQSQQPLSNGDSVVEWADVHGVANTGGIIQQLVGAAGEVEVQGGSYQLVCRLRFIVSKAGVIERATLVKDTPGRSGLSRCAEVFSG